VYGPWGRPDMAFFKFAKLMLAGERIPVYNHGELARDFTYIDDVVTAIELMLDKPERKEGGVGDNDDDNDGEARAPHVVYNIGNGAQVALMDYIRALERALGVAARYEMLPMQDGDVAATCADTGALAEAFGFRPATTVEQGLAAFAQWYRAHYKA
ncbi:MAG: NAD-dependent epimerase/dehydratase family protein, partial [bacterium]